eukprot:TRINITY_DN317_c0_g2_i2.p2 TRINITY_DN317_c0_g2~~TRINITY_DN317_c0_g2_i2.p2  ORF type:complete len:138 (+),score=9.05 TRINITY_DN317_c0_g2_i2:100-513(+)
MQLRRQATMAAEDFLIFCPVHNLISYNKGLLQTSPLQIFLPLRYFLSLYVTTLSNIVRGWGVGKFFFCSIFGVFKWLPSFIFRYYSMFLNTKCFQTQKLEKFLLAPLTHPKNEEHQKALQIAPHHQIFRQVFQNFPR